MSKYSKTVLVIAGPTAVGKTGVAIRLAQELGTAIISADSRQCYRGMSIGTAQPSDAELALAPHYFIDSFPVEQHISAADFEQMALTWLDAIFREHDIAIVCGGTGLYIKALCEGLDEMPKVDEHIATEIQQQYDQMGIAWLQEQVQQEDPLFYSQGEWQNPARLLRALGFKRSSGKSILEFRSGNKKERPFNIVKAGLDLPREVLYDRIHLRVTEMVSAGLREEVKALLPQRHLKNLQTVGYSELFRYFDGEITLDEAVNLIRQHTRNYAKRQLTWFRKDPEMNWFQADDPQVVARIQALL